MKLSSSFNTLGLALGSFLLSSYMDSANADCFVMIGLEYNGDFKNSDTFQLQYSNGLYSDQCKSTGMYMAGSSPTTTYAVEINCGDVLNTAEYCNINIISSDSGSTMSLSLPSGTFLHT